MGSTYVSICNFILIYICLTSNSKPPAHCSAGHCTLLRWCRDHCAIHPGRVWLHNRMNGVLWPWDIIAHMRNTPGHEEFFHWLHDPPTEGSQRCLEYWDHVSGLPFYEKLNITNPGMTVPLSWHMDGVKVYKTQKVWAYSFASAIKKGASIHSKSLFLLFRDNVMVKPHTHNAVGKLIGYVMDILASGEYPAKDSEGKSFPPESLEGQRAGSYFAGGWRLAFACFKADLEGRVLVHQLVRNWASDSICERCLASKHPNGFSYGDFSNKAGYFECMLSHEQFLMLQPVDKVSAWTNVRGWDITRNLDESCWQWFG